MSSTQPQIGNCPNCGLPVNPGSRFCMTCAYDLSQAAELQPTLVFTPASQQVACPYCGASVGAEATFCGNCGATLRAVSNAKKYLLIGGIAFLVLALAGIGVWYFFLSGGGGIPVSFTEKLLATMPRDIRVENYNVEFSPDGTRAAYIAKKEDSNKEFVVADGKSGKEYDQVRDLAFSLDASKLGYIAKEGEKVLLVVNDEETPVDYKNAERLSFDDDNTPTYLAGDGDKTYLFVGKDRKSSDNGSIVRYLYSWDGRDMVYLAKKDDRETLVLNDKKVTEAKDIRYTFPPDGNTLIYTARDVGKYTIYIGSKKFGEYDEIEGAAFNTDGSKVVFALKKDNKHYLLKDGKEEAAEAVSGRIAALSPDGTKVAYIVRENNKSRVVVGDSRGDWFDSITGVVFSPDGTKVAYVASTNSKDIVVVGDRRSDEFDDIFTVPYGRLNFNSSGSKVAFGARKDKELWWKVMDAK